MVNPFHVVVELFATAAGNDWISASTFHDYGDSQDLVQHSFGETAQDLMWIASIVHQVT